MPSPWRATYRLQFRQGMGFEAAAALAPYFRALGVSHVYASPIFQARSGSPHGYDIVDHNRIDPALGGEAGFEQFVATLSGEGLGLLLDIVPNHMSASAENTWWWDVLKRGNASAHAAVFDIDWDARASGRPGKVTLPVLNESLSEALARGEVYLTQGRRDRIEVAYLDQRFPLAAEDEALAAELATRGATARVGARETALSDLLERQHYWLVPWRAASEHLNWRRFFDINELVGVRVEDSGVFDAAHDLTLRLIRNALIDGLRIDHIDGLADPKRYVERLRAAVRGAGAPDDFPIIVEKIVAPGETLPLDWSVDGTTGYETLDDLTGVLIDPRGRHGLRRAYLRHVKRSGPFRVTLNAAKRDALEELFGGELEKLNHLAWRIARARRIACDLNRADLRNALGGLLKALSVYRSYCTEEEASERDREVLERARHAAMKTEPVVDARALAFIVETLVNKKSGVALEFAQRFQQLSGPLMAKALEDTAFYRDASFIVRNEVGATPAEFATPIARFFARARQRLAAHPRTLVPLATHDTKRGSDARARLAVIAETPRSWQAAVSRWKALNRIHSEHVGPTRVPDAALEYLLYQSLVGSWPATLSLNDLVGLGKFCARVDGYILKAAREAKTITSWTSPDCAVESALRNFVQAILDPARSEAFLDDIRAFVSSVAPAGAINGLAQVVLQAAMPGIPDIYQGTEFWDQSFVDPDNRRSIDFAARIRAHAEGGAPRNLLRHWRDGRIKQYALSRVLAARKRAPDLFAFGALRRLRAEGRAARNVLAFARLYNRSAAVAIVTRFAKPMLDGARPLPSSDVWADTYIHVPKNLCRRYSDVLSERSITIADGRVRAAEVLRTLPVALLLDSDDEAASAGSGVRRRR